ncbi:hypothetical protein [Ancylobacter pratisalsi]|uniref:Uncharacterized protein n=1 Tax=Ancylobacter pratisalsi TaxID=1745854 RepID=A0A6P1YKP0_9HYPH|nr:hypothetical protein [Ancylobacter pratisalsi]QIB32793.1 hypothetical protein G3A50_03030 [Ancylobacter pratisalsi]
MTLKNIRWSWSGISKDGDVVLALWEDEFDDPLHPTKYSQNKKNIDKWQNRLGNRHRIADIKHAQATAGGRVKVVILRAKDTSKEPRETAKAFPSRIVMKVESIDESNGLFEARVVAAP